jgi:hypothetical protein
LFQGAAIDIVGIIGDDPGGNGWVFGNSATANHVLVRRPEVTSPNTDWNIVSGQWISYSPTDFSHLGSHAANDCGNVAIAVVGFTTDVQTVAEINSTIVTVTIHTENVQSSFQLIVNASGTATANSDFSAGFPLSFTVPTGTNDLTFSIVINGDAITEGDETIILDLSASANVYFNIPTQTITITENVGLSEQVIDGMVVYPNPASTLLNIKTTYALMSIQCMDMSGRVVYSYQPNGHQTQVSLPIEKISAGSYFVQVQTENGISRVPLQVIK